MSGFAFVPTFSVLAIAFVMSLSSTLINRRFIDREKAAKWQQEFKEWKAGMDRAKKEGDKKLQAKLKRQEKRIMQVQTKMFRGQILAMFFTLGLFYGMWQLLIFTVGNAPVAYLPFSIPFVALRNFELPLFIWYMVCSFFSSTVISRIFGVGIGLQPQTAA